MLLKLKNPVFHKLALAMALVIGFLTISGGAAFAYTDPASGDLFYEAYDLVVNQILQGPIGYIIAVFMMLGGIILLVQGKGFLLPIVCIIGAALIIKSADIVGSFGFTLDSAMTAQVSLTRFLL